MEIKRDRFDQNTAYVYIKLSNNKMNKKWNYYTQMSMIKTFKNSSMMNKIMSSYNINLQIHTQYKVNCVVTRR